jgi:hypothetical protein
MLICFQADQQIKMSHAQRRFKHTVDFLDQCETNFKKIQCSTEYCEWDNTVTIRLDTSDDPVKEYKKKFGVNFMDENEVVAEDITSLIHVLNKLRITPQCIFHKKIEPSKANSAKRVLIMRRSLQFILQDIELYGHILQRN